MKVKTRPSNAVKRYFRLRVLAALRSGEFRQIRTALFREKTTVSRAGFCCLAVMCEVSGLTVHGVHAGAVKLLSGDEQYAVGSGSLNPDIRALYGVDATFTARAVHMNDSRMFSFEEIADKWEKTWGLANV